MLNRGLADGVDEHSVAVFAVHPKDQTYPVGGSETHLGDHQAWLCLEGLVARSTAESNTDRIPRCHVATERRRAPAWRQVLWTDLTFKMALSAPG